MAKRRKHNLASLDFEELLDLRKKVDTALSTFRSTLERQLESLGGAITSVAKRGRGSSLRGKKVKPKYRDNGNTWAGRGARPRWLTALLKEGRKIEEFAIEKTVGKAKKTTKRRTKK
jgi:DNA-binding protein H-NS